MIIINCNYPDELAEFLLWLNVKRIRFTQMGKKEYLPWERYEHPVLLIRDF